jgi:hypothetical protein
MRPAGEHGRGHDRAHSGQLEQVRPPAADQGSDGALVLERLGLEESDPTGQSTQDRDRGGEFDGGVP